MEPSIWVGFVLGGWGMEGKGSLIRQVQGGERQGETKPPLVQKITYRSTSLIRNSAPLAPYSKTMPKAVLEGGGSFV